MLLIDYLSRNPVELALPPTSTTMDLFFASINSFISNIEWNDNVILNNLANQKRAPHRLIKKCAEYKMNATAQWTCQGHFKHSKHNTGGHSTQNGKNHLTNFTFQNQQTRLKNKQKIINFFTKPENKNETRRRRNDMKNHEKGFIPDSARTRGGGSLSNITPIRRKPTITWRGESDREEILSDPRCYRRTQKTTYESWTTHLRTTSPLPTTTTSPHDIKEASEMIPSRKALKFPKIVFFQKIHQHEMRIQKAAQNQPHPTG